MKRYDVLIVGAGPAGLSAAITAAKAGMRAAVFDENARPGGQLFKQIHKFFGSKEHKAKIRDYRIEKAKELYRTGSCDRREVPYAVGFTDSKYFSQVFHKITGTTPSEYCQEYC